MRTAQQIEENKEKFSGTSLKAAKKKFDGRGKHGNPRSLANLKIAPYPKGVSGNPGGLPGYDVAAKIARSVFEQNEKIIYEGLTSEVAAGKPYAFEVAANRAYGKTRETLDVNVSGTLKLATSLEERRAKRANSKKVIAENVSSDND